MSFMLYMMLLPKLGNSATSEKMDGIRRIRDLKNEVAAQIHMTRKDFENETGHKAWLHECRDISNTLTHLFIEQSPTQEQAQKAIDSSINLIDKLAAKIISLYLDGERSLRFFQLVG
jgi:hypothetical protein